MEKTKRKIKIRMCLVEKSSTISCPTKAGNLIAFFNREFVVVSDFFSNGNIPIRIDHDFLFVHHVDHLGDAIWLQNEGIRNILTNLIDLDMKGKRKSLPRHPPTRFSVLSPSNKYIGRKKKKKKKEQNRKKKSTYSCLISFFFFSRTYIT